MDKNYIKRSVIIVAPALGVGGVERSLIGLLNAIDLSRYEVDLLLYEHKGELFSQIPQGVNLLSYNATVSALDTSMIELWNNGYKGLAFLKLLATCCNKLSCFVTRRNVTPENLSQWISLLLVPFLPQTEKHYDIALGFFGHMQFVKDRVGADNKYVWFHTDYSITEVYESFAEKMYRSFQGLVHVSEEAKHVFLSFHPSLQKKSLVSENVFSSALILKDARKEIENAFEIDPDSFSICSVGRFCEAKAFDLVIPAVAQLIQQGISVKWYLIGFGQWENTYRELIKQHQVENNVIILGKKTNPYPYMKQCSVYAQPSRYEGKAVAVREAQVLCKPVLVTNYKTAPSQVDHLVDGYITPQGIDGIATGVKYLYGHPELLEELSKNCSQRDYSNSEHVERLFQTIESQNG